MKNTSSEDHVSEKETKYRFILLKWVEITFRGSHKNRIFLCFSMIMLVFIISR